jgi:ABC transport system ATP-binding/permease protein
MALVSLQDVSLGFGGPLLLEEANLQIEQGESIGLLGRNGMGKTSLLRLIYGELSPDSGAIARQQKLRMAYLPQEIPEGLKGRVGEIVGAGLEGLDLIFSEHEGKGQAPQWQDDSWKRQLQVEKVISRMQLDPTTDFGALSAGMQRRVLLGRALAREPHLLLLDEPTNHLDIQAITWLEDFLVRWAGTLLFVTHDRAFLQRLAARIIELDRGHLYDWNCDYPSFLKRKDALLASEAEQNLNFDKKLAQEEAWIRRGVEARRTRNEGRVKALQKLRELRRERREQPGKVRLQIQAAKRSGRLVIESEDISHAYGDQRVIDNFSTTVLRGDRVGIIGPNGSGKTTLLRILIGDLEPDQGEVRHGTNLQVAYFDQLRSQLDESKSVFENVGEGRDTVTINGKARNLVGYLSDFLFAPDRVHVPINMLSGGERNRLLLARLFTRPANLLVLDEPTNDLDIETLEILENMLLDYNGTLLLVSHDREFLNNLVTGILSMDGSGQVQEYAGGYDDWLRQRQENEETRHEEARRKPKEPAGTSSSSHPVSQSLAPRKLSYNEQRQMEAEKRELAGLPQRIEALETEQQNLTWNMARPEFYQKDASEVARAAERLKELEEELVQAYIRWEELEQKLG